MMLEDIIGSSPVRTAKKSSKKIFEDFFISILDIQTNITDLFIFDINPQKKRLVLSRFSMII